jgi:hypothetical protein
MKHWIATVVVALMLSGCSQKAAFEEMVDGTCSSEEAQLVEAHISAQIDAIAKEEWESAYSYASPAFRSAVELGQFVFIIGTQYGMLIENQGYSFSSCTLANSQITQEVGVKSERGLTTLTYTLSVKESVLGVESALVGDTDTQLVT